MPADPLLLRIAGYPQVTPPEDAQADPGRCGDVSARCKRVVTAPGVWYGAPTGYTATARREATKTRHNPLRTDENRRKMQNDPNCTTRSNFHQTGRHARSATTRRREAIPQCHPAARHDVRANILCDFRVAQRRRKYACPPAWEEPLQRK